MAMTTLLWVMVAGGVGSGARYLVGQWAAASLGTAWPYGTLIVNLSGCFLLGVVTQLSAAGPWSPELRAAIAVGLLGGFTTYSSFNQETIALVANGSVGGAAANVAITFAGGLAAGALGLTAGRLLTP
jgi:CrcB protein